MTDEWIVNDGPENRCFGCGHGNERGLKLRFRRREDGAETEYAAPEELAGAPGVIHGGIQAALLDEVLGMAVHFAISPEGAGRDAVGARGPNIVTAEMQLRYRRPAPTGEPLRLLGRLVRSEGRDYFVAGEIRSAEGELLTTAEARWRRVDAAR